MDKDMGCGGESLGRMEGTALGRVKEVGWGWSAEWMKVKDECGKDESGWKEENKDKTGSKRVKVPPVYASRCGVFFKGERLEYLGTFLKTRGKNRLRLLLWFLIYLFVYLHQ